MNAKLSRTNGILSKLRHYVPKKQCCQFTMHYFTLIGHMEVLCGL